jgi:hypothetical protein
MAAELCDGKADLRTSRLARGILEERNSKIVSMEASRGANKSGAAG